MNYSDLLHRDVPRWYTLGLTHNGRLRITIDEQCWREIRPYLNQESAENERALHPDLQLADFIPADQPDWGFGAAIRTLHRRTEVMLTFDWPVVFRPPSFTPDWHTTFNLTVTLGMLWGWLMSYERQAAKTKPQLLIVSAWTTELGVYGSSLSVRLSRALDDWLRRTPDAIQESIERAMQRAYRRMWGRQEYQSSSREFRVMKHDHRLIMMCPGNACDLAPEHPEDDDMQPSGYTLVPHNTDSPLQQLCFLAGLAALCDLYDKPDA